jgi:hypothetical protein
MISSWDLYITFMRSPSTLTGPCTGKHVGLRGALISAYLMLNALHPLVVGHFDPIKLLIDDPDRDLRSTEGVRIQIRILRNPALAKSPTAAFSAP